jgi:hypothetical protein
MKMNQVLMQIEILRTMIWSTKPDTALYLAILGVIICHHPEFSKMPITSVSVLTPLNTHLWVEVLGIDLRLESIREMDKEKL